MPRKKKEPVVKASKPKTPKVEKLKEFKEPSTTKRRKLSHVLTINNDYYITCDKITFILKERVDGVDKNGKKLHDKNISYAVELQDILELTVSRMIKVPADFDELIKQMNHIYGLFDARIPANCKPKDLFEFKEDGDEL